MKKIQSDSMSLTQFDSIEELEYHTDMVYTRADLDKAVKQAKITAMKEAMPFITNIRNYYAFKEKIKEL